MGCRVVSSEGLQDQAAGVVGLARVPAFFSWICDMENTYWYDKDSGKLIMWLAIAEVVGFILVYFLVSQLPPVKVDGASSRSTAVSIDIDSEK